MHIHNVFRAYSQRILLYGRMKDEYIVDVHTYIHISTYLQMKFPHLCKHAFTASSKRLIPLVMDFNYNLDGCQIRNRKKFLR